MLNAVIVLIFILAGAGVGFHGVDLVPPSALTEVNNLPGLHWVMLGFGSLFGLAVGILAQSGYRRLEVEIRSMPTEQLLSRCVGLVVGLLVANLLLAPIFLLPIPRELAFIKPLAAILGSIMFAFSGINLSDTHGRALLRLLNPNSVETTLLAEGTLKPATAKILDTSTIIDGRVEDLLGTGFVEGQILVPQFVLQELQLLSDSSNDQKRVRGRRGLDILQRLRESFPQRLVVHTANYDDVSTVDAKLVRLAQEINGTLITNDYNLNKVATLQQVEVLNVNDLAQALRPVYRPGDSLALKILKEGKEPAQGIGYLEDGTMVVVEDGQSHLGGEVRVVVTSALQTSAGRMIFARPQAHVAA
ncbi:PIN/TRAM domain-containing protein [Leptolyngbya sp. FACHB-261]|uniref:PIN/TRAM domain-containing protein n=1 Tax=Leptolyngbya sp. FACHB-261 TaxID=2692806 RepID=UPI00168613E3|nr:PIN/TRAM domain-containing protein [Leptolyngbya sp. FACHB-261]MBD2101488.1 PIN/TRAM domain-containing protein [Leptolyngbya sp. FACHB-261]